MSYEVYIFYCFGPKNYQVATEKLNVRVQINWVKNNLNSGQNSIRSYVLGLFLRKKEHLWYAEIRVTKQRTTAGPTDYFETSGDNPMWQADTDGSG